MFNYVYNNSLNWFYPKTENQATEDAGNIPTANDYLSLLPADTLTEVMMYLPLESVQALSLTNHKIMPTTKPVIKFRTNVLIQELLENFDIYSPYVKCDFRSEKRKIFKEDVDRAKTLKNGSDERVKALRDAFFSIYQGHVSLHSLLSPNANKSIFKDKFLVERLMKNLINNNSRCTFKYNCNGLCNTTLFLDLLKTNQTHPKELCVEIFNVSSALEKFIKALAEALVENKSIAEFSINWANCDLKQLDVVLEAIKTNKRIVKLQIRDSVSFKKNCEGDGSWLNRNAKEKKYKEFEDLIKHKLKNTFYIQKKNLYGFFCCERYL